MILSPSGDGIASLAPDGNGLSSSTAGVFAPRERVIFPDDNQHHTPAAPVFAYNIPSPRLCGFASIWARHVKLFDSNDTGGITFDNANSDDQHPMVITIGGQPALPAHVFFLTGTGNAFFCSATSHALMFDAGFKTPILSNGTDTHYARFGYANTPFGAVTHGFRFEFDPNADVHGVLVTSAAGVSTSVATPITLLANTYYHVQGVATNNTRVDLYIAPEGSPLPSTPSCSSTTNIPSGIGQAFAPTCGFEKTAGTLLRQLSFTHFIPSVDRLRA